MCLCSSLSTQPYFILRRSHTTPCMSSIRHIIYIRKLDIEHKYLLVELYLSQRKYRAQCRNRAPFSNVYRHAAAFTLTLIVCVCFSTQCHPHCVYARCCLAVQWFVHLFFARWLQLSSHRPWIYFVLAVCSHERKIQHEHIGNTRSLAIHLCLLRHWRRPISFRFRRKNCSFPFLLLIPYWTNCRCTS